ncbi:putative K domain, type 1 protein [Helianthus annuus]|nr:putative K domain, type 1 protein [Helianthus annuus]
MYATHLERSSILLHTIYLIFFLRCQFNFVGKLLGPSGNTLKRIEALNGCRLFIKGRDLMKHHNKVQLISKF